MKETSSRTKRDEIVEVACDLFYEQGYHQTGIHQIISEAKTAKGTFYSHFHSKEHLGVYWLKTRHHQWMGWLCAEVEKENDPENKILAIFKFLRNWMNNSDFRGCAFINTLCETPDKDSLLHQQALEHKKSLIDYIETLIRDLGNELDESTRIKQAQSIFLLVEGTIVAMQNFKEAWPAELAKEQTKQLLGI